MEKQHKEIHPFDVQYLKSVTDSLQEEVRARGAVMTKMETHMATTNLILEQLSKKNDEQDHLHKEHSRKIHSLEMDHAKCSAPVLVAQHQRELKKLNAFMDMAKMGTDIDTGRIDVHAQRMQHAAESAIMDSIPLKKHILKSWPIILLLCIFSIIVTTLILSNALTGNNTTIPSVGNIPSLKINTNSSSLGDSK